MRSGEFATEDHEQFDDDGQDPTDGSVSAHEENDIKIHVSMERNVSAYVIANSLKWKEARRSSRILDRSNGKRKLNERDGRAEVQRREAKRTKLHCLRNGLSENS